MIFPPVLADLVIDFFSIKYLPTGPPIKAPATSPKVADDKVIVFAVSKPNFTKSGAKAALVPCPPCHGYRSRSHTN